MRIGKLAFLASAVLLLCSFTFAQTEPAQTDADKDTKAKEANEKVMQMIDQAARDGAALRLPLNRAIVYTLSGDLYWNFDEKRARELFRSVAAEIITYNQDTERERSENANNRNNFANFFDNADPRADLLPIIAKHDAQMALDMLLQTRPAKLAEAMAADAQPNNTAGGPGGGRGRGNRNGDSQAVAQEVALEQQLTLLAANEDPDKAVKLIKDMIAKGVSNSVLAPLQQLYKKDPKKAGELAAEVVKSLTGADWTANTQDLRVALNFLQLGITPTPATQTTPANSGDKPDGGAFSFTDAEDRDLANKLVAALMQPSPTRATTNMINQAMPAIQKYAPDKVIQLQQQLAASQQNTPAGGRNNQQRQTLFAANTTPEDILSQIPKMTSDADKNMAYSALGGKISQIDDDARAKKLLDQIPDDKAKANATEQYDAAKVSRSAGAGNLEDARKLIGSLTVKKTQIQKMVALATAFNDKGTDKDIEAAKSLMKDAKALVSESPDDEDELADLMEVVKGYAVVDPDMAFHLVEPIIDQFNDVVNASAVLSKYNRRNRSFKKGELVMKAAGNTSGNRGGGPGGGGFGNGGGGFGGAGAGDDLIFYRYIPQLQLLGKANLEQMSRLTDRFGRIDARTIVKLYVLQGYLRDDKKPGTTAAPTPTSSPVNTNF